MRQLHVVALSEDGRFLLLAPGKDATKGAFKVPVDARLSSALRGDLPRPGSTTAPASELTPKQIQARLRAGETVEQIARSAGVPAARVERFAGPVEGEMARVIDAARAAVLTRARRGASAVSLGEAVAAHLVEADVEPGEVVWTARRQDDGAWLVEASFTSRGRKKRSAWRYEPGSRELTAADASSAVLGYVEPPGSTPANKTVAAPGARRAAAGKARTGRRAATPKTAPAAAPATRPAPRARAADAGRLRAAAKASATASAKVAAKVAVKAPVKARAAAPAKAAVKVAAKAPVKAPAKVAVKAPVKARVTAPAKAAVATTVRPAGRAASSTAPRTTRVTAVPAAAKAPAKKAPARASGTTRAATATRRPAAAPQAAPPAPETAAPSGPPQLRVVPPPAEPPKRASVPAWADVLLSTTPPSRPAAPQEDGD